MSESRGQVRSVLDAAHLPGELVSFLNRDSYSLLIKGGPATGKTILALTLLRVLDVRRNYLFVSTRASPTQLINNMPWLMEFLPKEDTDKASKPVEEEDEAAAEESQVPENFIDARLDEPTAFFERVTNELMDVEAPLIVVDTWNPIGEAMERQALLTNIRVLQTWRERANARIIFLSEDPEDKTLDSVVDGVVVLSKEYTQDRMVRTILLSKLQGVQTDRPSSLFTLNNGIFQNFERTFKLNPKEVGHSKRRAPAEARESEAIPDRIPAGVINQEVAVVLEGRLPPGSVVEIEVTSEAKAKAVVLLLDRLLTRPGTEEKLILLIPPKRIDSNYLQTQLRKSSSAELFVLPNYKSGEKLPQAIASVTSKPEARHIRKEVLRLRREHTKKPLSIVTDSDILAAIEAEDPRKAGSLTDFLRSRLDMLVLISGKEEKAHRDFGWLADVRLGVSEIKGTLLLEPEMPWGGFYAFVVNQKSGRPNLDLVAIS